MNFNEWMRFPRGSSEGTIEEATNSLHTNGQTWGKRRVVHSVLSSECRPITSSIISAPFATDSTRRELSTFDTIDKKLTEVIEQKKMLEEEQLKLDQQGRKNLKDRARSSHIETQLKVLQAEVLDLRQQLLHKPR